MFSHKIDSEVRKQKERKIAFITIFAEWKCRERAISSNVLNILWKLAKKISRIRFY